MNPFLFFQEEFGNEEVIFGVYVNRFGAGNEVVADSIASHRFFLDECFPPERNNIHVLVGGRKRLSRHIVGIVESRK